MRFNSFTSAALPWVVLRPIDRSDIPKWYEYLALPHVVEHTSWNLASADDLRPIVDGCNSDDPASAIRFAIADRSTNLLIGTVGFHTIWRSVALRWRAN
ncbi:MAG: GNAT family N-acetyltransferase [Betaproteobacteria bacterium]